VRAICSPFPAISAIPALSAFLLPAGLELAKLRLDPREHLADQEKRSRNQDRLCQLLGRFHCFLHPRKHDTCNSAREPNIRRVFSAWVLDRDEKKTGGDWRQRREHFIEVFVL
jgi:hypothetical protein